jgi:hypothetical protein
VLSPFDKVDAPLIQEGIAQGVDATVAWMRGEDFVMVMNQFNKKGASE